MNWNLEVLSKAVHYRNLSAASAHVGLSQPQLSRIVQRLEEDLGLLLLDRSVKRKSAWTATALQLAEIHQQTTRRLEESIALLQEERRTSVIYMGTLEGLVEPALRLVRAIFRTTVQRCHLDVYDSDDLDAKFLNSDLSLVLTSHLPSKGKPKFSHLCGYQTLDWTKSDSEYRVLSTYEFNREKKKAGKTEQRTLVSNSLLTRKLWLEKFGGLGQTPSPLQKRGQKGMTEVLLLGNDSLDPKVWEMVCTRADKDSPG